MRSRTRRNLFATMAVLAVFLYFFYFCVRLSSTPSSQNENPETFGRNYLIIFRSGKSLTTLFRTWPLARVRISMYNVEEDQTSLAWVKSSHTVSGYGQLKYVFHYILPEYVEKVIFIDTDMLVLEDISILHSYFSTMEREGIMFAATSDQYRRKNLEKTFGKGASRKAINSGLVLYNLKAMRDGGWSDLWRETGVKLMKKLGELDCPQDLFAAVAMDRPDKYLKLPCVYNFQMGKGSLKWDCIKNKEELWRAKIPHWSSVNKYYETSGHTSFFSPIYRCFQKLDGYEFEEPRKETKYRTLLNLRNTKREEKADDVTLAAYVKYIDAINLMHRLNTYWHGPISLVICGSSWERAQLLSFIFSNTLHDAFDVHFVYQRGEQCPDDYLRRVAIDAARTSRILISDSITTIQLDEDLRSMCASKNISHTTYLFKGKKKASFAGVLLEKSQAQQLAAGNEGLEKGIGTFKLKFHTIDVDPAVKISSKTNDATWKLEMPTDNFCQHEINWRR